MGAELRHDKTVCFPEGLFIIIVFSLCDKPCIRVYCRPVLLLFVVNGSRHTFLSQLEQVRAFMSSLEQFQIYMKSRLLFLLVWIRVFTT